MEISEVRVKLVNNKDDRLKAFCSMTIDNQFVIRDIKVIEGVGGYFVAMPSRKMSDHCERCGSKNHLRAKYCNNCGTQLFGKSRPQRCQRQDEASCRYRSSDQCRMQAENPGTNRRSFTEELERSKQPGYKPVEMDEPDDYYPDIDTEAKA